MTISNRLSFTKTALASLPLPEAGKRAYYYDIKTRGLCLAVTGQGRKSFYLYRKIRGKPERLLLGHFPEIGIDEARAKAQETNAAVERGVNPADKRRQLKLQLEWTVGGYFAHYLEHHAKPHKRSWQEDAAQFQRYLQDWKERPLLDISRADAQSLHLNIGQSHGNYAANRLLSLLQTLFDKAIHDGWEHPNPIKGLRRFTEKSRERFLQASELPRLFQALAEEPNPTLRDYVLLSLLTGARKSNVLAMRWQEIDFSESVWNIPLTKNGSAQTVPLIPAAAAILRQRRQQDNGGEFVFPGDGKTGHWVEPKKGWHRLLKRAGIENLRLHDLRRSLGSWQAATGANLAVIGKTLNHKDIASTAVYARLNLDPVRQAMQTAALAMQEAGGSWLKTAETSVHENDEKPD